MPAQHGACPSRASSQGAAVWDHHYRFTKNPCGDRSSPLLPPAWGWASLSRALCEAAFSYGPQELCAPAFGRVLVFQFCYKRPFSPLENVLKRKGAGFDYKAVLAKSGPSSSLSADNIHNNNHLSTNRQQSSSESNELRSEPRQEGFNVQLGKLGEAINYIAPLLKEQKKNNNISVRLGQKEKIGKENTAREI